MKNLEWIKKIIDLSSLEKRKDAILVLTGAVVGITRIYLEGGEKLNSITELVFVFIFGYITLGFIILPASLLSWFFLKKINVDNDILIIIICATVIAVCTLFFLKHIWVPIEDDYFEPY